MRASVLDLGSNSFHVLVADEDDGRLVPALREREMLHLGATVARHGHIPAADRDRAVATVSHLAELARRSGATERFAVATAALRDATNGPEVIAALTEAAGIPVRVLDGLEEARLAYLGVRAAVAVPAEPVLVLDLGGGSLELAVGAGGEVAWATSLPLGASRLSTLVEHDPAHGRELRALHDVVDTALEDVLAPVAAHAPAHTVAVGGTVRALARVVAADLGVWLPLSVNQMGIATQDLRSVRDQLTAADLQARLAMPGMKSRRADHLHVAAVILSRVLQRLAIDRFTVSDWGLREGLLLDAHGLTDPPSSAELRRREVDRIRQSFVPEDQHSPHVALLVGRLFDETSALHGLADTDRALLEDAALLHDVGHSLALRRHHLHSAYIIENAELRGYAPEDVAVLTLLARYHVSSSLDAKHPAYASLQPARQQDVRQMLALFQIADGLDRTRDQLVRDLHVQRTNGRADLVLDGTGLAVAEAELKRKAALFETEFDVEVRVIDRVGT